MGIRVADGIHAEGGVTAGYRPGLARRYCFGHSIDAPSFRAAISGQ